MSSPAQVAAHRALCHFGRARTEANVCRRFSCKISSYSESRGEAVTELNLIPDKGFLEEWRLEWDATLKDAGIDSPADRLKTVGWIESKAGLRGSSNAVSGSTNLARLALEAFESVGADVPPEGILALDRAIAAKESGRGAGAVHMC